MNLTEHQSNVLIEIDALIENETDAITTHALEEGRAAFLDYVKSHTKFEKEETA